MHDHDQGLAHDLQQLQRGQLARRRALQWLAGSSVLTLLGCGGGASGETTATSADTASGTDSGSTSGTSTTNTCSLIPEETAGPYPGDGSNSANGAIANALALSGIVRSDIRTSIAGATGVAGGVPLTMTLKLLNTSGNCASLAGYAIYLWHCDREGRYSMYSSGVTGENYLRGVQVTGSDGTASFTTIFPGCYLGRMPHMHFEIYRNANTASSWSNRLRTSQIAFAVADCSTVYAQAPGYSASAANLGKISFASDNVFSDGVSSQMATLSGNVAQGYTGSLSIGLPA